MQHRVRETHQLCWTRFEVDGKCISNPSHTVHKANQDNVIIPEGRSWVVEKIEHREIDERLYNGTKVVDCILCKKVGQAAHTRSALSPVIYLIQIKCSQSRNPTEESWKSALKNGEDQEKHLTELVEKKIQNIKEKPLNKLTLQITFYSSDDKFLTQETRPEKSLIKRGPRFGF